MFLKSKKRRLWQRHVTLVNTEQQQLRNNNSHHQQKSVNSSSPPRLLSNQQQQQQQEQQTLHQNNQKFPSPYPTGYHHHPPSPPAYSPMNDSFESGTYSNYEDDDDELMASTRSLNTTTTTTATSTQAISSSTPRTTSLFLECCWTRSSTMKSATCEEDKQQFQALISKLSDTQLSTLLLAVGDRGPSDGRPTDCVLIRRETIMDEDPIVIACRLWRWTDLRNPAELKRIPSCRSSVDPVYICCNPHHWSRLCFQDTPPPPYQPVDMDLQSPEKSALNESIEEDTRPQSESFSTDGNDSSNSSGWCQLAYWEQAHRVGDRYPVENPAVNVFFDQSRGDGMCLKILSEQRKSETPDAVCNARKKIGLGIILSQETDSVWLYNRSSYPVFIYSPTLNSADGGLHVSKVQSGYCLKAYNYRAKSQQTLWPHISAGTQTGPIDTLSMRISFAKGWGRAYKRQDITGCPCWLEVLLTRR